MTEMLAFCGLVCDTCPIHLATLQTDREEQARMRAEIVRQCKEHYRMDYKLEEITDCDGCRTVGERLFLTCKKCQIRICAREKHLQNCAFCTEFPCEKLGTFFKADPAAKARLETLRRRYETGSDPG
jgi:hypothetical protein